MSDDAFHFHAAQRIVYSVESDLRCQILLQALYVADDAYFLSTHLVQPLQCVDDSTEIGTVEGAESFVNEDGVHSQRFFAQQ